MHNLAKAALLAAAIATATAAHAAPNNPFVDAPDALYVGAWTYHPYRHGLNGNNHLDAVEVDGWIGGYFRNSYNRDTVFAGHVWHTMIAKNVQASLIAGIDRGYTGCFPPSGNGSQSRVCPLVAPAITYTRYALQPTLILLPGAMSVTVKLPF